MRSTQRSPGSFTCESAEISFGSAMIHLHASPVDQFSYASSPYSRSDRWAEGSPITPRRQAPGSPGILDASGPCATSSNTTGGCAKKTVVAHARVRTAAGDHLAAADLPDGAIHGAQSALCRSSYPGASDAEVCSPEPAAVLWSLDRPV